MSRSCRACLLGLFLLTALGPSDSPGQDPSGLRFSRADLQVGGRITEVLPHDLDGDGRADLLVVRGREALLFFQGADGSWPTRAGQRFRFHPRTILFDVADLEGDGQAEIVLLQPDGIYAYRLRRRSNGRLLYGLRAEKVLEVTSFLSRPVEEEVRRKELLRDLDQDGRVDLLLPRRDGFSLFQNQGEGRFLAPTTLATPPKAILHPGRNRLSSQLFASYWFPNPLVAQWDGEDAPEILVVRTGTVTVLRPRPGAGEGIHLVQSKQLVVPDQKEFVASVENPFELDFHAPLVVRDLDQDGRVDLSSTHVGQGMTRIFHNTGKDDFLAKPTQSIRAKGVTLLSFYFDIDGDGLLDLILPRMDEVSVWSILKVLITRSVPLELLIYFQRAEGPLYPADPDLIREIEVPVSIDSKGVGVKLGTLITANLGDFDGDGRQDLLYRTESDSIEVFRGLPRRQLAEAPSGHTSIPDVDPFRFCVAEVADLNGDSRDDVILRYVSWDRTEDTITLLLAEVDGG